jgi:hypothetical protein
MRVCPLWNMLEIGISAAPGVQGSGSKSPPIFDDPTPMPEVCQTEQIRNDSLANSLLVHVLGKGVAVLFFPSAIKRFNFSRTALLSSPYTIRPPGDTRHAVQFVVC